MSAVSGGRVFQTIRGISVPGNGWQATLSSPYANGRFDLRSVGRMVWVRGFPRSPSAGCWLGIRRGVTRSEEHTSELQSLMRNSYAVFCLKKKKAIHILQ